MQKLFRRFVYFVLALGLASCNPTKEDQNKNVEYLFLGHAYQWFTTNQVDYRLENIALAKYNLILLGGDLCVESSNSDQGLDYLDAVFSIHDANSLWTIGNHDLRNGSLRKIEIATRRKSFYAFAKNGVTFLVLNTNINHSEISEIEKQTEYLNQKNLIKQVCDTISSSSHLLVLSHNVVWEGIDGLHLEFANLNNQICFDGENPNFFKEQVYPQLIQVEKRGVEVIWMAGDIGKWSKKYEYLSKDGIQFLASGINNTMYLSNPKKYVTANKDKLLILKHHLIEKKITWQFIDLDYLYLKQLSDQNTTKKTRIDTLCIEIDSLYLFEQAFLENTMENMRKSKKWIEKIKQKAQTQNRSVEEMIWIDANYVLENKRAEKLSQLYQLTPVPIFSLAKSSTNSTNRLE